MFTPSQRLAASQTAAFMAASGLGLQPNPSIFHPGFFVSDWTPQSPPSPQGEHTKRKKRKKHNNINVDSSSVEIKQRKRKKKKIEDERLQLSPPNSASSGRKKTRRDKRFACGVCNRKITSSRFQSDANDEIYLDPKPKFEEIKPNIIRRLPRPVSPLISLPLMVALPEQTEPEDLSMSTGRHSSANFPLFGSPSSPGMEEDQLDNAAALLPIKYWYF